MNEAKHAKLSASGAERWINCPGSIKLSEEAPPQKDSKYALEGTKAHTLFEKWLIHLRDKTPAFKITKDYPRSMVDAVRVSVMDVSKIWAEGETGILETETRVSLGAIDPDMFGTLDVRIVEHFGTLWVLDYKHGGGVPVDVVKGEKEYNHNLQLVYYALASAFEFEWDFEKIVIGILQPRALHAEGPLRLASLTPQQLRTYEVFFRKGVERTKKPDPRLWAGTWCRWCPAKTICPAFKKTSKSGAAMAFAGIED